MSNLAFGMDAGFIKTGFAVFDLEHNDSLIRATTLTSDSAAEKEAAHYVALADARACANALMKWHNFFEEYKPKGVFIEIPSGGAQGARANRCMGMATAMVMGFLDRHNVAFELYLPSDVELALGIHLNRDDAKKRGFSKGDATAWKKQRLKDIATGTYPEFDRWPSTKALAEDSYDAVAAFLCGKDHGQLYAKLMGIKPGKAVKKNELE